MHDEISLLVSMTTAAGTCYISSITDRNRAQLQQANAYMISILKTFCFLCVMTCDNLFIMNTFGLSDLHFSNLINIISLFYILEESYWYDRCTAVDCNYLKTWTFSGFNKAFLDTVFALKKKKTVYNNNVNCDKLSTTTFLITGGKHKNSSDWNNSFRLFLRDIKRNPFRPVSARIE